VSVILTKTQKNHGDSSITYNAKLKETYLNLNYIISTTKTEGKKICSIDPGVCNFVSIYSDSAMETIGINSKEKLYKLCKEIDIISSRINRKEYYEKEDGKKVFYKVTNRRKKQLKKAMHRKIKKIQNMTEDLHSKAVKYITENYEEIIIPPFKVKEMTGTGMLHSQTSRMMYTLSHYKFRQRLERKCKEKEKILKIREEYYTSKTCTNCGNIKHDLKLTDRIYECKKCGLKIKRDYSGPRNILLRNIK